MTLPFPRKTYRRTLCRKLLPLLMCAAGALAAVPASAAPSGPETATIAGRRIEARAIANPDAQACVVFENGSRGTMDSWDKVIGQLGPRAAIFAYNRPGYANSQITGTPRDGATIVEELRPMLRQKGCKPPYVLVGHSLGGLYMQLFARRYPNEVGGLVLVDAVLPRMIRKPEEFPLLTRAAKRMLFSATINDEFDAIHKTGEQVLALPPIDDKPIVRFVSQPPKEPPPFDIGVFNFDRSTVKLIDGMYPTARKIVLGSSHQIHQRHPAEVAQAIETVLARLAGLALKR